MYMVTKLELKAYETYTSFVMICYVAEENKRGNQTQFHTAQPYKVKTKAHYVHIRRREMEETKQGKIKTVKQAWLWSLAPLLWIMRAVRPHFPKVAAAVAAVGSQSLGFAKVAAPGLQQEGHKGCGQMSWGSS